MISPSSIWILNNGCLTSLSCIFLSYLKRTSDWPCTRHQFWTSSQSWCLVFGILGCLLWSWVCLQLYKLNLVLYLLMGVTFMNYTIQTILFFTDLCFNHPWGWSYFSTLEEDAQMPTCLVMIITNFAQVIVLLPIYGVQSTSCSNCIIDSDQDLKYDRYASKSSLQDSSRRLYSKLVMLDYYNSWDFIAVLCGYIWECLRTPTSCRDLLLRPRRSWL